MDKIKAGRFIVYIANLYFKLQILLLFLLLIYLFYQFLFLERIGIEEADKYNFFTNNIIIFSALLISCLTYFFIEKDSIKNNYFLIHLSTIFSLFLLNLLLEIRSLYFLPDNRIVQFEKKGVIWDNRTHNEVISDLKTETGEKNIYRGTNPGGFIVGNIAQKIDFETNITPFSNISNSTIVYCNESGTWHNYKSDKFGFNNPENLIKIDTKFNLLLLGDSFTEGMCVDTKNDIGAKLRNLNYNVLNLGKAAGGVLFAKARLREYKHAYNFKPEFVIYLFYSFNDVTETRREYNHPFFQKYLNDKQFSQDLKNKQDKIDIFWKRFFALTSKADFLKKYPALRKYGQYYEREYDPPTKRLHYKFHLKNILLLTNIRAFIHDNLIAQITNRKSNEKKKQLDILKKVFTSFKAEVNEIDSRTKLILVYLPSHHEIINKTLYLRKEIINLTNELNVDYINIYESFIKININDLFDQGLPGHYSSEGYGHLARIINQHLLERYGN